MLSLIHSFTFIATFIQHQNRVVSSEKWLYERTQSYPNPKSGNIRIKISTDHVFTFITDVAIVVQFTLHSPKKQI